MKLTQNDLKILEAKGIETKRIDHQLEIFRQGFPFIKIDSPTSTKRGIKVIDNNEADYYIGIWNSYIKNNNSVIFKFVPASGAATRMFKNLFDFLETSIQNEYINYFFDNIDQFAFYADLNKLALTTYKKTISNMLQDGCQKEIIHLILDINGLNYSFLPKALIKFHTYKDSSKTALEEHLVEGYQYAKNNDDKINIHFTVSSEHRKLFTQLIDNITPIYNKYFNVQYKISLSEQMPETDTIAVDEENHPFRDENEDIILRPAGHGALIKNLNAIDADIIFIKNIDNVVPDKYKDFETRYKKVLAGYLISTQIQIFKYLNVLESNNYNREILLEILSYTEMTLNIIKEDSRELRDNDLATYLNRKLNRPIRVCGMVKNEGESGGGPFFTINKDNSISLQILEESQIDKSNIYYNKILKESTHFNPVDIVCGVKNYKGVKFDLIKYTDPETGFISKKSYKGKTLKALELPGLWNGAMSDWNTIFIETPLETFNPVKNANDLLREHHLNK